MCSNFDVNKWLDLLLQKLVGAYKDRLIFVGHTGSWVRGEAGTQSDIDMNVILSSVGFDDIKQYRQIIKEMPNSEKACGFIGSKEEIQAWPRHELFHFINGCRILYGDINNLVASPTRQDLIDYIKITSSAIIHEVRHRMIYTQDINKEVHELQNVYKSSFFILQACLSLTEEKYILSKKEILAILTEESNREILKKA